MKEGKPSLMAERVAITRALHQLVDDEPKIFPDPLALRIIGPQNVRWMHENLASQQIDPMPLVRAMVCLRARFTEDELMDALADGTAQYVVLGAGLDTFAYRRPDLASHLTVFEVDHPDTQAWKQARLAEADIPVPPNLRFVPVDFNTQSLGECLSAAGFCRDEPAFFSWLGVTYYLPHASITGTLRYIGQHPARCQVVFDFAMTEEKPSQKTRDGWIHFNNFTARAGEPWQTWLSPDGLTAELRTLGFTSVFHLDAGIATHRYLKNRSDMPGIGPFLGIMSARH